MDGREHGKGSSTEPKAALQRVPFKTLRDKESCKHLYLMTSEGHQDATHRFRGRSLWHGRSDCTHWDLPEDPHRDLCDSVAAACFGNPDTP